MKSNSSVVRSVRNLFGNAPKSLEPILMDWKESLGTRNSKTAMEYTSAVRLMLEKLGISGSDLITKLKSGEMDAVEVLSKVLKLCNGVSPHTISARMNAMKQFLFFNDIDFDERRLKHKVMMPRLHEVVKDRILTPQELATIYTNTSARNKVILLLGIHGLRVGEMVSIKVSDIVVNQIPRVNIRAEISKDRRERTVPLTPQAISVIGDYVNGMKPDELVLSGITTDAVRWIFKRLLIKNGLDKKVYPNRRELHVHTLRKYCKSMLLYEAHCNESIVNRIIGHREYLDNSYLRCNIEQITKEFQKAIPVLTIGNAIKLNSGNSQDRISKLEAEIAFIKENMEKLVDIKQEYLNEAIQQAYERTVRDGMVAENE